MRGEAEGEAEPERETERGREEVEVVPGMATADEIDSPDSEVDAGEAGEGEGGRERGREGAARYWE